MSHSTHTHTQTHMHTPTPTQTTPVLQHVLAPAKLNLFLHITAQRADGYHELQSVFTLIDWFDVLNFELSDSPQIKRLSLIHI